METVEFQVSELVQKYVIISGDDTQSIEGAKDEMNRVAVAEGLTRLGQYRVDRQLRVSDGIDSIITAIYCPNNLIDR